MLKQTFKRIHKDLKEGGIANPDFSGTTCCIALLKGRSLYTANSGDSRAILINKQGKVAAITEDQKPDDREEMKRIVNAGGRV